MITPLNDIYYYCDFTNSCGSKLDSVLLIVIEPSIEVWKDTIICPGESVNLYVTGAESYYWSPSNTLSFFDTSQVIATPFNPTIYNITGTDQYGCISTDSVFVGLYPNAFIQTSSDVYAFYGDEIQLSAYSTTSGTYSWDPSEYLSCVVCDNPVASPDQNFFYIVSYTDDNGCEAEDSIHIYYDPILFVPNTFTPGYDEFNNSFFASGGNINRFKMLVFDRWGEVIFESLDINVGWDGTYKGQNCQDGTYVWKINLTDFNDKEYDYLGHINLVR
jgi:gliding motility-associated-like protein